MAKGSELRAKLRGAVLDPGPGRVETVDLGDGLVVELRQPTVGGRSAILKAAGVVKDGEVPDLGKMQAEAVLQCSFVPGTGERAFERADVEAMLQLPAGGAFDKLADPAVKLLNVDTTALGKGSGATPEDSSSSGSEKSSVAPSAK